MWSPLWIASLVIVVLLITDGTEAISRSLRAATWVVAILFLAYLGRLLTKTRSDPQKKLAYSLAALSAILVIGLVVFLPTVPTSDRKVFWINAQSIKNGDSWEDVKHRIEKLSELTYIDNEKTKVTFTFRAGKNSADHLYLVLTADGNTVESVEIGQD